MNEKNNKEKKAYYETLLGKLGQRENCLKTKIQQTELVRNYKLQKEIISEKNEKFLIIEWIIDEGECFFERSALFVYKKVKTKQPLFGKPKIKLSEENFIFRAGFSGVIFGRQKSSPELRVEKSLDTEIGFITTYDIVFSYIPFEAYCGFLEAEIENQGALRKLVLKRKADIEVNSRKNIEKEKLELGKKETLEKGADRKEKKFKFEDKNQHDGGKNPGDKIDGYQLESYVRQLLSMQGWNIRPEHLIGHKKVDGLLTKSNDFGQQIKYVLECKDHSRPLTRKNVTEIYADYLSILKPGGIDGLLLVTSNGLTSSAYTYCSELTNMTHMTYMELLNHLLDFRSYVNGLILDYKSDDIKKYYVEQTYEDKDGTQKATLEWDILKWVENQDEQPLAVLAGYGMGKTTLSRRISCLLGENYIQNPNNRIPILIKLDNISSDQSLEGLLGKQFTSLSVIQNYNFHIFMKLNALGRFVILLDGFDEMKRTMSIDSMRYNFTQLNRLVVPKSKVVLLGRPTAFLTEHEYWEALHGRRVQEGISRPIPGWPNYRELRLLPFNDSRIEKFIKRYYTAFPDNLSKTDNLIKSSIDKNTTNVISKKLIKDVAKRPVQLRMLMEVLPHYKDPFDCLTTSVLYFEFIELVIRREMKKISRQAFTLEQRRQFASDLAFWMWMEKIGSGVTIDKIPDSLFEKYKEEDKSVTKDGIKRDLLSACFLEKKEPDGYYFSHRSFLEFLVAERIASFVRTKSQSMLNIGFVSPELTEFFVGMINYRDVERWKNFLLSQKLMPSESHIQLFAASCKEHGIHITKKELNKLRPDKSPLWANISLNEYISRITLPPKSPHKKRGVTPKKKYTRTRGRK